MKNESYPLISVIIPVYNGEKTIYDTISSVLKQTYSYFEIILVDDGSDQPVESLIRPLIADNRLQIYRLTRSNANIARNYGIGKSQGSYIAMLDADDCWLDNHLQDCLSLIQESDADGLYGSIYLRSSLSESIDNLPIFHARALRESESMIDYLLNTGCGAQTSTLFTKACFMKEILWDATLQSHQDYDFVFRFCKKYRMTVKKEPSTVYYLSSGRVPHYESCIRFVKENIVEINPEVYMSYNFKMFLQTKRKESSEKFVSYFRKEAIRYKEYLSYQHYISICNPKSRLREWVDKLRFLFYILRIKLHNTEYS